MTLYEYSLTWLTILVGAIWLGVGSELGRDFYKLVWKRRVYSLLKRYRRSHKLLREVIKEYTKKEGKKSFI